MELKYSFGVWGRREMHTEFLWGNLKKRDPEAYVTG
jgi:hypothetical protein